MESHPRRGMAGGDRGRVGPLQEKVEWKPISTDSAASFALNYEGKLEISNVEPEAPVFISENQLELGFATLPQPASQPQARAAELFPEKPEPFKSHLTNGIGMELIYLGPGEFIPNFSHILMRTD